MSKWIKFIDCTEKKNGIQPKTKQFGIITKDGKTALGIIKWYGPFRQYSFFPEANMVFEKTCLQDITDFIKQLEVARKEKIKLAKKLVGDANSIMNKWQKQKRDI